jgi:hypothetical protein
MNRKSTFDVMSISSKLLAEKDSCSKRLNRKPQVIVQDVQVPTITNSIFVIKKKRNSIFSSLKKK